MAAEDVELCRETVTVTRDVTIYRQNVLHTTKTGVEEQSEGRHQDDLQAQGERVRAPHRIDKVID